jgi:hypothetical protein
MEHFLGHFSVIGVCVVLIILAAVFIGGGDS